MLNSPLLRRTLPAAVAVAVLVAGVALVLPAHAPAEISSRLCSIDKVLTTNGKPIPLRAKVNGRTQLIGKVYVSDEGGNLCAVTTSRGTNFDGESKYMSVTLSISRVGNETDARNYYQHYAGRIRLDEPRGRYCFLVGGSVRLHRGDPKSTADDPRDTESYAACRNG